jgi:uncharacterized protein
MKISNSQQLILAGGSGFLGNLLARHFIARGWQVTVLTRAKVGQRSRRAEAGHRLLQPVRENGKDAASAVGADCRLEARQHAGDRPETPSYLEWDGHTLGNWTAALEGADAVINLAGRSVNCRYHARNRRLMLDSRVNATRVLGEAIARCGRPPRVWLNFSTATIYKHTLGPAWDEVSPGTSKPATNGRFKTSHSEAGVS